MPLRTNTFFVFISFARFIILLCNNTLELQTVVYPVFGARVCVLQTPFLCPILFYHHAHIHIHTQHVECANGTRTRLCVRELLSAILFYFPSMENICCFGLLRFGCIYTEYIQQCAKWFFIRFGLRSVFTSIHIWRCAASLDRASGTTTICRTRKKQQKWKLLNVRATPPSARRNVVYVCRMDFDNRNEKENLQIRLAVYVWFVEMLSDNWTQMKLVPNSNTLVGFGHRFSRDSNRL